jgi:hypothetical protein
MCVFAHAINLEAQEKKLNLRSDSLQISGASKPQIDCAAMLPSATQGNRARFIADRL